MKNKRHIKYKRECTGVFLSAVMHTTADSYMSLGVRSASCLCVLIDCLIGARNGNHPKPRAKFLLDGFIGCFSSLCVLFLPDTSGPFDCEDTKKAFCVRKRPKSISL